MAQMFYAQDCNLEYLKGKKIAIVGYGSQGHAHALNLRDSGCDVVVALYEGSKSWKKAEDAGLTVMTTAEAAKVADMIMILINDEKQAAMYHKDIEPYLRPGMILAFAHGFNIHFGCIKPPKDIDVVIGPEARGFVFSAAVAYAIHAGLVMARKPGKLPYKTISYQYGLEYGTDELQIHVDSIKPGQRVAVIDDLLATGGTALACAKLVEKAGGTVAACCFAIELEDLKGRETLKGYPVDTILVY